MFRLFPKMLQSANFGAYVGIAFILHILFALCMHFFHSPFYTPSKPLSLPAIAVSISMESRTIAEKTTRQPDAHKKDKVKNTSPQVLKKAKVIAPSPKEIPSKKTPVTDKTAVAPQIKNQSNAQSAPKQITEQTTLSANHILKNLAEQKIPLEKEAKEEEKEEPKEEAQDIAETLTISELDAFRQQLSKCWIMPINAEHSIPVTLEITARKDGSVENIKTITPTPPLPLNAEIAVTNATRTFYHPECTPLLLPQKSYQQWQTFLITFDAKGALV